MALQSPTANAEQSALNGLCDLLADAAMQIDAATAAGSQVPKPLRGKCKELVLELYDLAKDVAPEHWAQTMGTDDA